MILYQISFYISKGNIEEVKQIMPQHWVYGRDFFIDKLKEKQQLVPDPIFKTEDVSVLFYKRSCKCDYLPWSEQLSIGNDKTDGLSFHVNIEPNELPTELYNTCRSLLFRISSFINESLYICSKCQHNNGCCQGSCAKCCGRVVPCRPIE